MFEKFLKGSDEYSVVAKSIFNDYDRKVLARLYQPLIGFGAMALYLTLWSELEAEKTITTIETKHSRLLELMQISINDFVKFKENLEAVGLLQTYVNDENKYVYELRSPLMPKDFYNNDLFVIMLKRRMDSLEYERNKIYFLQHNTPLKGYQNISVPFEHIFDSKSIHESEITHNENENIRVNEKADINLDFDFDVLFEGLKEYQMPKKLLTKTNLKAIAELSVIYSINAYEMCNLVLGSMEVNKLNVEKLKVNCENYNRISNKKVKKQVVTKENNSTGSVELDAKINLMNQLSFVEFLKIRNNGIEPLAVDKRALINLQSETGLSDALINVIVDYTLLTQNNKLPKAYMDKIAGSFIREGIQTAFDAIVYLNGGQKKNKKKVVSEEKVNKVKENDEVSIEEYKKNLEQLENLLKMG